MTKRIGQRRRPMTGAKERRAQEPVPVWNLRAADGFFRPDERPAKRQDPGHGAAAGFVEVLA